MLSSTEIPFFTGTLGGLNDKLRYSSVIKFSYSLTISGYGHRNNQFWLEYSVIIEEISGITDLIYIPKKVLSKET